MAISDRRISRVLFIVSVVRLYKITNYSVTEAKLIKKKASVVATNRGLEEWEAVLDITSYLPGRTA